MNIQNLNEAFGRAFECVVLDDEDGELAEDFAVRIRATVHNDMIRLYFPFYGRAGKDKRYAQMTPGTATALASHLLWLVNAKAGDG